jgi:hypothetical protein
MGNKLIHNTNHIKWAHFMNKQMENLKEGSEYENKRKISKSKTETRMRTRG